MERIPQLKARLVVSVMDHETVVGTDGPLSLEFQDCVEAVAGLVSWLASALEEVNNDTEKEIGTAILAEVLHQWTFDQHVDAGDDSDDSVDKDQPEDSLPPQ